MNRKSFISALVPLGASLAATANPKQFEDPDSRIKIPEYLNPGDIIGITSPAGYITDEDIKPAILKLQEWGYNIKSGNTIGKRDFTYGGTDAERLADFQQMLDDKNVKAVMCARGGYGALRIIDKIDFTKFVAHPKWIIGFSDITVMHSHINRNFNIASIHSKMCNSFPTDWLLAEPVQKESIESIRQCLAGEKMQYKAAPNLKNRTGVGAGQLVGGNLKTLETLAGSSSDISTKNKLLFVEDTGEYMYSIDRMFWNLKRSGKLANLRALIIGGFKEKKDDTNEEFGKILEEVVLEKVKEYDFPVCFDFPVGHQKNNYALKCGVRHTLKVNLDKVTLEQTD